MTNLEDLFKDLHTKTVELLLKKLDSGEITHQELETARRLLNDNGIDSPREKDSPIHQLGQQMPFPPTELVDPDGPQANFNTGT